MNCDGFLAKNIVEDDGGHTKSVYAFRKKKLLNITDLQNNPYLLVAVTDSQFVC